MNLDKLIELIAEQAAREAVATTRVRLSVAVSGRIWAMLATFKLYIYNLTGVGPFGCMKADNTAKPKDDLCPSTKLVPLFMLATPRTCRIQCQQGTR